MGISGKWNNPDYILLKSIGMPNKKTIDDHVPI